MPKEKSYRPTKGDVIEWNGNSFYVIQADGLQGEVIPVGENFVIRNFQFNGFATPSKFIRRMTKDEMIRTGLELTE